MESFSNVCACTCSQWIIIAKYKERSKALGRKHRIPLNPLDLCKYKQACRTDIAYHKRCLEMSVFDSYSACNAFLAEAVLVCRAKCIAGFTHLVSVLWARQCLLKKGYEQRRWWQTYKDLNVSSGRPVCQACATLGSDSGLLYFRNDEPTHWTMQTSCA